MVQFRGIREKIKSSISSNYPKFGDHLECRKKTDSEQDTGVEKTHDRKRKNFIVM